MTQYDNYTLAIWTFTFHKISGFVGMILKANFKQLYSPTAQRYQFFDLKIQKYYSHFPSIVVKSNAFFTLLMLLLKRLNHLSHIFAPNCNSSISTLRNSINSVQKALDLTTPAKNRRKMTIIIDLNFQVKKLIPLACRVV